jgi:RNA polymerase sigma-70 factor (ECF subfamily)
MAGQGRACVVAVLTTKIESPGPRSRPYPVNVRSDWTRNGGSDVDADLIGRAQHGDEEAFASLAVAAGNRLHAVAHRILRDTDLAEDATQQALLAIWRDLPQLRDPARFDAWSYRLLVRACYAEGRRTRRWAPIVRILPADGPDDLGSVVDRDQLERGFRRLSIDHRAVVVLHHYLDLPLDEVADALGVPVGTVRSRLHHAMRGLRAALEADARSASREVAR